MCQKGTITGNQLRKVLRAEISLCHKLSVKSAQDLRNFWLREDR